MKHKYDPNNFVIDKVFDDFDKWVNKKMSKTKKGKSVYNAIDRRATKKIANIKPEKSNDPNILDGPLVVEINV